MIVIGNYFLRWGSTTDPTVDLQLHLLAILKSGFIVAVNTNLGIVPFVHKLLANFLAAETRAVHHHTFCIQRLCHAASSLPPILPRILAGQSYRAIHAGST